MVSFTLNEHSVFANYFDSIKCDWEASYQIDLRYNYGLTFLNKYKNI